MLKRITFMITIGSSLLFALSLSEIKEASPNRLGCIKGIGEKRLQRITTYQKEHTISKMEDTKHQRDRCQDSREYPIRSTQKIVSK